MEDFAEQEIRDGLKRLHLMPNQLRMLDAQEQQNVFRNAQLQFMNGPSPTWWWGDFKQGKVCMVKSRDRLSKWLTKIVSKSEENAWLIIESKGTKRKGHHLVFEGALRVILAVIETGSDFFEYYIIPSNLGWLIGENEEQIVYGAGQVIPQLKDLVSKEPTNFQNLTETGGW